MSVHVRAGAAKRAIDVVAIGASAGAIETLRVVLAPIPRSFGAALLLVIHVPATGQSVLADVLGHHCALSVREAIDKEKIEEGMLYIAPAGYHLLVEPDGTLSLSVDAPVSFSRPSIDVLFESAAYAYRDRLLGIVLTGANEDGAEGLVAVRRSGGLAWVQDPGSAVAAVMPRSAIERAGADAVYDPSTMAAELVAFCKD
jgi:two-component system, chemotaxis family, protein-glutamate methylesterase/glutaminase